MAAHDKPDHPDLNPETAPDPDEDDLDDLDEMLDEFSSTKIDSTTTSATPAPASSGPGRPAAASPSHALPDASPTAAEDDFAKEIQSGMADMLKELQTNPEMARQFEEMMAQFGAPPPPTPQQPKPSTTTKPNVRVPPPPPSSKPAEATPKPTEDNFQETIRRTMDRMKASSSSASAAATNPSAAGEDDIMATLLRELQDANGGADGDGDDTFSKMLLGMMEQLTNKEILYEPMKELDNKFPAWLEGHKGALPVEDERRYGEQRALVREIVGRFEREGYSDGNAEDREFIVEKMQKMQAAGAPPPDLVGDVDAASNMMNDMDSSCPQQ